MNRGDEVLGKLDISQLMSKAVVTETIDKTAGGTASLTSAILSRQQADRFIDLVVDTSVLLKAVRIKRIDHPSGEIDKMDLGDIVTESAAIATPSTYAPTSSDIHYDTAKVRSCFDLTSDFTEDNIEGTAVRDKLLDMFTKRIAIDLEVLALEGDASVVAVDTRENRLIQANDGFHHQILASAPTPVDANGASASAALYFAMKKLIPARYRVAAPDYRFVVPSRTFDKWNYDLLASKGSATGAAYMNATQAQAREATAGGKPFGTPLFEVPLAPVDLSYDQATDGSWIWLTPLQNLIFFIQRDITIEWDRVPRSDKWEVTIHTRNDFECENYDMIVYAKDVGVNGADYA